MQKKTFQKNILAWYRVHRRELPWRSTTDPYKIIVSEFMLQQTQVSRVIPIYNKFLLQFPDVHTLARASLADVLRAWKGLGYNRRAKHLWLLAQEMSKFPYGKIQQMSETELRELPGIGHYTAAAVLAFSANRDVSAVDTNVRKIHHRVFRDTNPAFITSTVPSGHSRDWHNALMDFGSMVCTKQPQCEACPLRRGCLAYKENDVSFSVPKQSTFKGSNRFYRGRILDALRESAQTKQQLLKLGPKEKVDVALAGLVAEQLVKQRARKYTL